MNPGKGYWMEGIGTLRAEGENRPSRPGHIVLDCIGGQQSEPSVIGCDIYNLQLSGDKAVTLTANACSSSTHAGPAFIVLNDQGGSIMEVSDKAACLRAQDHGHPPIICGLTNRGYDSGEVAETLRAYCFEPGIAKRDGSDGRFVKNKCGTLRAEMGDNQPAVCYAIDHVVTTGGNCTAQGPCYYENICPTEKASGVHAICYEK